MILRSVMKHVREQNWFAVVLDFMIVVVGVFIGIQVANWNEERAERNRESGILEELASDLCSDLEELENTAEDARYRFSAQAEVLRQALEWTLPTTQPGNQGERPFHQPEKVTIDSASVVLYDLAGFTTFDPERAAYDGLVSSNDILLIQDKTLVESLQQHFARIRGFNDTENITYRGTVIRLVAALESSGLGTLDEIDWRVLTEAVQADPALQGVLKSAVFESARHHRVLGLIAEDTRDLLGRLGRADCG